MGCRFVYSCDRCGELCRKNYPPTCISELVVDIEDENFKREGIWLCKECLQEYDDITETAKEYRYKAFRHYWEVR